MEPKVSLNRIRLELARTPDFPTGSSWHGYEFIAPLTVDGHVDAKGWSKVKELCHVTRFWGDDTEERGQFVHSGQGWCFVYPEQSQDSTERFFKLDRHRFTPGGYVTVTERDGSQLPFRVVAMTPAVMPKEGTTA
jgi:hypothetical protein